MKMTPKMLILGGLIVFWVSISVMVIFPVLTMDVKPSEIYRPMTDLEKEGLNIYVNNGCSYCHSLYMFVPMIGEKEVKELQKPVIMSVSVLQF